MVTAVLITESGKNNKHEHNHNARVKTKQSEQKTIVPH